MPKLQRVLIMAGGTGGHIFPGLAVANWFREHNIEVHWLGTEQGLEAKLIPEAGIPLHFIAIQGVRGKRLKNILLAPFKILIAIKQAGHIIRKIKPDVVLGMGGFVSGPGGIASWLLRCPLVIHEQNARAGTTNKYLAYLANKILEGFSGTFPPNQQVIFVGNPIRSEIKNMPSPKRGVQKKRAFLILGGSLGAAAINQLVPQALARLPEHLRPEVYHQAGEKHIKETLSAYEKAGVDAKVVPFIQEMDKAYAWADFVLCRAGALTIAELCAAGLGAILIPFPQAIDDHQTANANVMVRAGAALLAQQAVLTLDGLVDMLQIFINSSESCQRMAEAAYQLRQPDAAEKVGTVCYEIVRSKV